MNASGKYEQAGRYVALSGGVGGADVGVGPGHGDRVAGLQPARRGDRQAADLALDPGAVFLSGFLVVVRAGDIGLLQIADARHHVHLGRAVNVLVLVERVQMGGPAARRHPQQRSLPAPGVHGVGTLYAGLDVVDVAGRFVGEGADAGGRPVRHGNIHRAAEAVAQLPRVVDRLGLRIRKARPAPAGLSREMRLYGEMVREPM